MRRQTLKKLIIAVIVIGSASAFLVYKAIYASMIYYLPVDEFLAKQPSEHQSASPVRLVGWVEMPDTMINHTPGIIEFTLKGKEKSIDVIYSGTISNNFKPDREVVVEGKLSNDGTFKADRIITRCESKYRSRLKENREN